MPKKSYSYDFKKKIIDEHKRTKKSINALSKEYNVSYPTIKRWISNPLINYKDIFYGDMKSTGNINEYINLLKMNYSEAILYLTNKYGNVKDDYFTKNSYQKFLDGKNESITRGKYSRSSDGLECHHILENKYPKISDKTYIKSYNYPFELQMKNNLVYCNLIEHLIIHAIISKETEHKFGELGYISSLAPVVFTWYISKNKYPYKDYHAFIYKAAYLNVNDAKKLLSLTNEIVLGNNNLKYINPYELLKLVAGYDIDLSYYDNDLKQYLRKYKKKFRKRTTIPF